MNKSFMRIALEQAVSAFALDEVPVGAVLVHNDQIISSAYNQVITLNDPTAHAEMIAIKNGSIVLNTLYLNECDLYVTLEPCPMCAYAISLARIRRLYFAAYDSKSGGVEQGACIYSHKSTHHKPEVYGGIQEIESSILLKKFFMQKRN